MNEDLIKALLVAWQGVLDRLQYDENKISKDLRENLENEFRYMVSIIFGVEEKDVEKMEKAIKEYIKASFN
jgi:type II restriction/modification system DNA methylase subunit YeeA